MTTKAKRGHKKAHKLLVRVTFTQPCTAREAAAMFNDSVYGDFYPAWTSGEREFVFTVRNAVTYGRRGQ